MTDIICPLCGKPNSPDLEECQYCQAPLKTGGFIAPAEGEAEGKATSPLSGEVSTPKEQGAKPESTSSLEQAIPDWLKETEASFLEQSTTAPEESTFDQLSDQIKSQQSSLSTPIEAPDNTIDDDWLASLLAQAGAVETAQPELQEGALAGQEPGISPEETLSEIEAENLEEQAQPTLPSEKPDWLTDLEASSKIKLDGGIFANEADQIQPAPVETPKEKEPEPVEPPEWLTKPGFEAPPESPKEPESSSEAEAPIAPAELPGWLEAIRPSEAVSPTGPVEDVSGADMVTAGPLAGLRGVISPHPSAIRAQKPPTYSIKLKVTEEQQARVRMMEELLEDEGKPTPLPSKPIISPRHIFRLIIVVALLLPMIWMIISNSQHSATPQPGSVPGVVDFTQRIQALPANAPVLIAFDYEAGFSGEMNLAITNVVTQLMNKSAYLTLVATSSSGPALAESIIKNASSNLAGTVSTYPSYADLGYIPGGTMGLLGLVSSPKSILPYALNGSNVWAKAPLNSISTVKDFSAVIVITNDPDTARIWIEQVGSQLQEADTPLLFVTSAQAEPLIRPYYEATPAQVQGLIAGLTGGVAYARTVGDYQQNGTWDAYSAGVTVSVLIIFIGSIVGVVLKMPEADHKKET